MTWENDDSHLKDHLSFLLKPITVLIRIGRGGFYFFYPIIFLALGVLSPYSFIFLVRGALGSYLFIFLAFGMFSARTSPYTILANGGDSPVLPKCLW